MLDESLVATPVGIQFILYFFLNGVRFKHVVNKLSSPCLTLYNLELGVGLHFCNQRLLAKHNLFPLVYIFTFFFFKENIVAEYLNYALLSMFTFFLGKLREYVLVSYCCC